MISKISPQLKYSTTALGPRVSCQGTTDEATASAGTMKHLYELSPHQEVPLIRNLVLAQKTNWENSGGAKGGADTTP